ncbi:flagellar protein FlaG [Orrella sp. JC864]|uniref:flagellar protein FlaG n=1 Tax=Orrella sp. JC864 TaxID=3120298 RepID=UPI00300A35AF
MTIQSVPPMAAPLPVATQTPPEPLQQDAARTVTAASAPQQDALGDAGYPHARQPQAQQPEAPASLDYELEEINRTLQAWSTKLQFQIDPEAQRLVVTVQDAQTGETIRTIPSDAVIRIAKMIVNMQGQLVRTQA